MKRAGEGRVARNGNEAAPPARVPWTLTGAVALVLAVKFLPSLFAAPFLRAGAGSSALLAGLFFGTAATLIVVVLILLRWVRDGAVEFAAVGFRPPSWRAALRAWSVVVAGAAAYFSTAAATVVVLRSMGIGWKWQQIVWVVRDARGPGQMALAWGLAVVLAPVLEETAFRGVLYLPLRARLGVVPAALIVSFAFSAAHFYPYGAGMLFVLSLTFVALFERTGSLWLPIAAHGLYNGIVMVLVRHLPIAP